jgi:hypothetical protein
MVGSTNNVGDLPIGKLLTEQDIHQISCCRDLFSFGTALFEILTAQTSEDYRNTRKPVGDEGKV